MGRYSVSEKGNRDGIREIFGLEQQEKKKKYAGPFPEIRAVPHTLVCFIMINRGELVRPG